MTESSNVPPSKDYWRDYLEKGEPYIRVGRKVFSAIPSDPRCRMCTAPFGGIGGPLMRVIGRSPSVANPHLCTACGNALLKYHGGAEVSGTMLFADVRGSTALAERMSPAEFKALMERFYTVASWAVIHHDGAIDKFVGDELIAFFYPALAGERHVAAAIGAAQELLRETGHDDPAGPWAPIGAGVHTGRVWFGAIGDGSHVELTSLGDVVNTTARLASAAGAGEILVSTEAASTAELEPGLERRSLQLKGKEQPIDVVVVRVGDSEGAAQRSPSGDQRGRGLTRRS
jgi:adenylate cyclase